MNIFKNACFSQKRYNCYFTEFNVIIVLEIYGLFPNFMQWVNYQSQNDYIPSSQVGPAYLVPEQPHTNSYSSSVQEPPCLHGLDSQSFPSFIQI